MENRYLKPKQYYIDLYDLFTIKECLDWYWKLKEGMEKHRDELKEKEPKTDFDHEVHKCCSYAVNVIKGERYRRKAETIQKWIDKDKKNQDIFDKATPHSDILCKKCGGKTKIIHKTLHSEDENNPRISFMFECKKCNKRQIFYSDGSPWDFEREKCPDCGIELKTEYEDDEKNEILITTDYCLKCDYKKVDVTNFKKNREEREEEKQKDEALLKEYRDEFCWNDKDGQQYISTMETLKNLYEEAEQQKKKEKDPNYQKTKKLKKLKINQLKELLSEKLNKQKYIDLQFGKPEIGKYVVVDFTVNDTNNDRSEYDSNKQLKKLIQNTLIKTNWRLMSDGISYRIGILSGRLKAYERDDDLMKIIKN